MSVVVNIYLAICVAVLFTAQTSEARSEKKQPLRILYAEADLDSGNVLITGEEFVQTNNDEVLVTLNGQSLTVNSLTNIEISAELPSGITEGNYLLTVSRGQKPMEYDVVELRISSPSPSPLLGPDCTEPPNIYSGADLRNCDLDGNSLSSSDLSYAILLNASLTDIDLSNANLNSAYLDFASLTNIDLSGANLIRADLNNTNLSFVILDGADLSYADLSKTQLQQINLTDADLTNTDLRGAYLSYVYLISANLANTDLRGAYLSYVDLTYANLTGANLSFTTLDNITWDYTTCPDGTNSNEHGGTCEGNLNPL